MRTEGKGGKNEIEHRVVNNTNNGGEFSLS